MNRRGFSMVAMLMSLAVAGGLGYFMFQSAQESGMFDMKAGSLPAQAQQAVDAANAHVRKVDSDNKRLKCELAGRTDCDKE